MFTKSENFWRKMRKTWKSILLENIPSTLKKNIITSYIRKKFHVNIHFYKYIFMLNFFSIFENPIFQLPKPLKSHFSASKRAIFMYKQFFVFCTPIFREKLFPKKMRKKVPCIIGRELCYVEFYTAIFLVLFPLTLASLLHQPAVYKTNALLKSSNYQNVI